MKNIDNQFIEALAAQYIHIDCCKMKGVDRLIDPVAMFVGSSYFEELEYLELRSIDSLTDEEYIEVAKHFDLNHLSPKGNVISLTKDILLRGNYKGKSDLFDYLRSIEVLLPFRGVSVEEMLESGKVKLKS